MIGLLLLTIVSADPVQPEQAPEPVPRVASPEYLAAGRAHDQCLIEAAEKIALEQNDYARRYALYSQQCIAERAVVVAEWMKANPGRNAEERQDQYRRVLARLEDRADNWAVRFLDPKPPMFMKTGANASN